MVSGRGLGRALAEDWRRLGRQLRVAVGSGRTAPGLYQFRFGDNGKAVRLHLRIQDDGSGLLFVNVGDVVHLSPGAAEIARMLLDGTREPQVAALLSRRHPEAAAKVATDVRQVAEVVDALKNPSAGCPTCSLDLERREVFSQRARAPYKADLALTYTCNNRCGHCYNEVRRGAEGEDGDHSACGQDARGPTAGDAAVLSEAHWREVLHRLAGIGVPHIIFTGGEPTLHEGLPALVRHAERLGLVTGLNTNGRRLSDAGLAVRLARAGLDHVQVTLASDLPDVHNAAVGAEAFGETVQGIRNALAAGLHTLTNTTLTRANCGRVREVVEFIAGLGVTTFAMNGMICSGGGRCNEGTLSEAELVPLLQEVQDRAANRGLRFLWYTPTQYCRLSPVALGLGPKACNAAEYSVCIEPNGDVLPCQSYYERAGNILGDDWRVIWESDLFTRIRGRREAPRETGLPDKCWECVDLGVCGGGCMLELRSAEG